MAKSFSFLKFNAIMSFLLFAAAIVIKFLIGFPNQEATGWNASIPIYQALDSFILILIGQLLLACILTLMAALIALLLAIWRSASGVSSESEVRLVHKLFAAALTLVLFNASVKAAISSIYSSLSALARGFLDGITSYFGRGFNCISNYTPGDQLFASNQTCVVESLSSAVQMLSQAISSLGYIFESGRLELTSILGAIIFYVIVTLGFSRINSDLNSKQRFWLGYGTVAVFSLYLTLSAILAVPLLNQVDEEISTKPEELQGQLTSMIPEEWGVNSIPESPVPTTERERSLAEALPQNSNDWVVSGDSVQFEELKRDLGEIEGLLQTLDLRRTRHTKAAGEFVNGQVEAAMAVYILETDIRRGQRESVQHFLSIRRWFQFVISDASRSVAYCQDEVDRSNVRFNQVVEEIRVISDKPKIDTAPNDPFSVIQYLDRGMIFDLKQNIRAAIDSCDSDFSTNYSTPERGEFGSSLGIAGAATSWLLSTESTQVALITGLIGFGLLGSLVARFVSAESIGNQSEGEKKVTHSTGGAGPDIEFQLEEIGTVVFTGFCAAIIVYVASYGGLAIFSADSTDPNPYVVFGACLVGAVYSKLVWERARKAFLSEK